MKLNYFGYLVERHSDGEQFVFDLQPFISAFHDLNNNAFKSQFHYGGENLYLIRLNSNIYLYLMSKSQEIVKKIKETDLTVTGVLDLLEEHEKLGFASFLYVGDGYLGFASTILAPKSVSFTVLMNDIFEAIGLSDYKFIMRPLFHQATTNEVVKMPIHGRAEIQIARQHKWFDELAEFFGADPVDFMNVGSIEVVFKPESRKSIDPAVKKVLANMPSDGVESFMVRAKQNAADQLSDIYITGKGNICDVIKRGADHEISRDIREAVQKNQLLKAKVSEHKNDANTQKVTPQAFAPFGHVTAWTAAAARLLPGN